MKRLSTFIIVFIALIASANHTNAQCTVPTGLGVTVADATSMNLSWTMVAGAISYDINVQNGPGNPVVMDITTNNIAGPSFLATGLVSGSNYKFKVRTDCVGDHSGWSAYFFFTAGGGVAGDTCDTPAGLFVSAISATGATLNWETAGGAIKYRVRVEDGSGNPVAFALNAISITNNYTVTGLNAASNYKFKVRSSCPSGKSGWSTWSNFTTAPLRDSELMGNSFLLYPNPATAEIHLKLNNEIENSIVTVLNVSGQVVYQQSLNPSEHSIVTISTSDLSNGIYHVMINSNGAISTQKFTIVH